jgi:chloride channel 7
LSKTKVKYGGTIKCRGRDGICGDVGCVLLYSAYCDNRHFDDKGKWWTFARKSDMKRWALTFVTGFWCGMMALAVSFCTKVLSRYKFDTFHALVEKEKDNELPFGTAYAFLFVINAAFGLVAWTMVVTEPLAAGSGIPEVKCFLNGLDIPRLVKIKTLTCKAVGIICAVSAGLPVGKEGPMVHMGAIVAGVVSQVTSTARSASVTPFFMLRMKLT